MHRRNAVPAKNRNELHRFAAVSFDERCKPCWHNDRRRATGRGGGKRKGNEGKRGRKRRKGGGGAVNGRQATRRIAREKRNNGLVVSGRGREGGSEGGWRGRYNGSFTTERFNCPCFVVGGHSTSSTPSTLCVRQGTIRTFSLCLPLFPLSPPDPRSRRTTARNAKPFHYQARSGSLLWRSLRTVRQREREGVI